MIPDPRLVAAVLYADEFGYSLRSAGTRPGPVPGTRHGSISTYTNRNCRCLYCFLAWQSKETLHGRIGRPRKVLVDA